MNQYEFDKLLEKYLQGACSPEEELLLDEWSNRQLDSTHPVLQEDEIQGIKKQIWSRIKQSTFPPTPLSIFRNNWFRLGMAASFLLIFSVSILWFQGYFKTQNIGNEMVAKDNLKGIEITNTTDKQQTITLNDGTTVILQQNSRLTFPEKFGDHNRTVYLKGEGFFKVKRDTTKPFYVHAGSLVTEVLGTSFTVKSFEKDKISEVIVVSGKVKVYDTESTNGSVKKRVETILTPNQKVVFDKNTLAFLPQIIEKPIALNPPKLVSSFIFEETPLFEVLQYLEIVYGLHIVTQPSMQNCLFSGDLNTLELNTQLDMICKSVNAQYEKRETNIFITGLGCH